MKSESTRQGKTVRWGWVVPMVLGAVFLLPSIAWAQDSKAQKPYIMILMDTSASMEWTDEGDEEYPNNDVNGSEADNKEWKAGKEIFHDSGMYGPCHIWEPACGSYERPAWLPDDEWTEAYSGSMSGPLTTMRSSTGERLEDDSQPRHVTLKEILTGDMIMYRDGDEETAIENISPIDNGPGCWIVPRQRDASAQDEQVCESDPDEFEKFPDYNEPRPHFQEVFDGQRANGLMDTVAGNAIFAIAMFDGYKDSLEDPVKGWDAKHASDLDDSMNEPFAGLTEGKGDGDKDSTDSDYDYNLGIFQMISPKKLDMGTSVAGQLSNFVQYAFIDAGYLSQSEKKLKPKENESDNLLGGLTGLDVSFSKELDKYLDDYHMGRQPMARATPLSAAIYDIHQFFAHGKDGKDEKSPILEDPYKQCRPKHVIMMTDGYPEPEKGGLPVGGNTLNAAFGYNPDQYPYSSTEEAIRLFVNDLDYTSNATRTDGESFLTDTWSSDEGLRYNPRVHIVGLQVGTPYDGVDEEIETQAIAKLAEMAMEGKTCAGSYLDDLKPGTDCEAGTNCCDPNNEICLDPRQGDYMRTNNNGHVYPAPNGDEPPCLYPALILTENDREAMAEVFQRLFNSILSEGVTSRTRPTFVNGLDDPDITNPTDVGDAQGGQFRIFSGVEIEANSPFWRGLLFRESLLCTDNNQDIADDNYLTLHGQIDDLAGTVDEDNDDAISDDRRRIFTSFATDAVYDYDANKGTVVQTVQSDGSRFVFRMDMTQGPSGMDEFDDSYLSAEPAELTDRRIPFEFTRLEDILDILDIDPYEYFQVRNSDSLVELVNEIRGRSKLKEGRALGAILNSSPVAVGPPDLDLPVDSYRSYKTLYADRPSMLYFATTDGMLHAVYSGELHTVDGTEHSTKNEQVKVRQATSPNSAGSGTEIDGSMHDQREAWAYIPQMLHNDLSLYVGQQPYLMDGTPTVKDVRLCHKTQAHNQNRQACRYNCTTDECLSRAADNQWRSVLVAGLGEAGSGYFALDVTRPGGSHESAAHSGIQAPDPVPLWEFDPNWERGQVEQIGAHIPGLVYPQDTSLRDDNSYKGNCDNNQGDAQYFWDQPFMGRSVSEASIGTVAISSQFDGNGARLRRPVAIFSGGEAGPYGTDCAREERSGRAIYVVDLQTGTLIRRFVSYKDPDDGTDNEYRFEYPVSGTPALYNAFAGSLVTRGFVGDQRGRLFRLDLSSDDPLDWSADLFFDPAEDIDFDSDPDGELGPASFKPALALGTQAVDGDLLIYYGLGERGDLTTADQTQLMIALREEVDVSVSGDDPATSEVTGSLLWHVEFEGMNSDDPYVEKLTGAPVVFNRAVYFTTFLEPADDRCEPGWSRIYGMQFEGAYDADDPSSLTDPPRPIGAISNPPSDGVNSTKGGYGQPGNDGDNTDETFWYYEPTSAPSVAEEVIVRGLAVTLGPSCSTDPAQTGGGMHGNNSQKPTLVAQTSSGMMPGDTMSDSKTGASLTSIEHELPDPQSQSIPLSWSVIDN